MRFATPAQQGAKTMDRTPANSVTEALLANIHRKLQETASIAKATESAPKAATSRLP
jgi:hypothetical protein